MKYRPCELLMFVNINVIPLFIYYIIIMCLFIDNKIVDGLLRLGGSFIYNTGFYVSVFSHFNDRIYLFIN